MFRHGHGTRSGGRSKKLVPAAVETIKADLDQEVIPGPGEVEEAAMEVMESKLALPSVSQTVVKEPAPVGKSCDTNVT